MISLNNKGETAAASVFDRRRAGPDMKQMTPRQLPIASRAAMQGMTITLCTGTGEGPTPLAAFDAALVAAGVADHNLICLSSVIPPSAVIVRDRYRMPASDYGRRLYVVMSEMRQAEPGQTAHAGIGWMQDETDGRGLFVELHDDDRSQLERDLFATLDSMRRSRATQYGSIKTVIESRTCSGKPVCALVAAVYGCEPW
jgi:arginine decarboxylase